MPLAEILNLNRVQVEAEVPEIYLKNIKKGDAVNVKFPALDRETRATVSLIGQKINPANRTFKVEIDIPNSGDLKPNLLAVVQVRDKEQQSAVVLPSEIIQQDMSGQSFVFVKSEDENGAVAKKVFVQLGETYDGETAVIQGLTGNEQLIIKGARELKNNELIEIKAE
jgi:multidrug efflux pump subunit AcrA (membrane-fusion protein)